MSKKQFKFTRKSVEDNITGTQGCFWLMAGKICSGKTEKLKRYVSKYKHTQQKAKRTWKVLIVTDTEHEWKQAKYQTDINVKDLKNEILVMSSQEFMERTDMYGYTNGLLVFDGVYFRNELMQKKIHIMNQAKRSKKLTILASSQSIQSMPLSFLQAATHIEVFALYGNCELNINIYGDLVELLDIAVMANSVEKYTSVIIDTTKLKIHTTRKAFYFAAIRLALANNSSQSIKGLRNVAALIERYAGYYTQKP